MSENIIHVQVDGSTHVFDITHPGTPMALLQLGVDLDTLPNFGIHLQPQEQAHSQPTPLPTEKSTTEALTNLPETAPAMAIPETTPTIPSPSLPATPPPTDVSGLQAISFGSRSREEIQNASSTPPVTVTPPPKAPINRWGTNKPPVTYMGLIALVLDDLGGQGTLKDIFNKVRESFPYYNDPNQTTWMNSIRQCLSVKKEFTRTRNGNWAFASGVNKAALVKVKGEGHLRVPMLLQDLQPMENDPWKGLSSMPPATAPPAARAATATAPSTTTAPSTATSSTTPATSTASAAQTTPPPHPTETAPSSPIRHSTWMPEPSAQQLQDQAKADWQEKDQEMRKSLLFHIAEFPAIWRMDHPFFKEQSTKRRAWEDILTLLKKKYGEDLMDHQLTSVTELMGAFSTLKTRLTQEEKRHKKRTGMAANEVQPISWPFYSSMEFLRQASAPLPTESSADMMDIGNGGGDTGEAASGGSWNPRMEKQRRSLSAKEKKAWGVTKVQEMTSKKHEEVLSTLAAVKDTVENIGKKKEQKKKKKRDRDSENDEDEAFAKLLATQTRQVFAQLTEIRSLLF